MQRIFLIIVCALALLTLAYYTHYLTNDPYSRFYTLRFREVRGLRIDDPVEARGVNCGKVARIELDQSTQSVIVTIKVLPALTIETLAAWRVRPNRTRDDRPAASIVTRNSFGRMKIEIEPGYAQSEESVLGPDVKFVGTEPERSSFAAALKRRDPQIQESIEELDRSLENLSQGDGSLARILYDSGAAASLDESIADIETAAVGFEESMANLEAGDGPIGRLLSDDPEAAGTLRDDLAGLREGLADLAESGRDLNRGDGAGAWLNDSGLAASGRETASELRETTREWRRGESGLGRWLVEAGATQELRDDLRSLSGLLQDADEGRGSLGEWVADRDRGKALKEDLKGLAEALRAAKDRDSGMAAALRSEDSQDAAEAFFEAAESLMKDADDAIRRSVAEQPVNSIHGAVFLAF